MIIMLTLVDCLAEVEVEVVVEMVVVVMVVVVMAREVVVVHLESEMAQLVPMEMDLWVQPERVGPVAVPVLERYYSLERVPRPHLGWVPQLEA
jgi:hypothetical protein